MAQHYSSRGSLGLQKAPQSRAAGGSGRSPGRPRRGGQWGRGRKKAVGLQDALCGKGSATPGKPCSFQRLLLCSLNLLLERKPGTLTGVGESNLFWVRKRTPAQQEPGALRTVLTVTLCPAHGVGRRGASEILPPTQSRNTAPRPRTRRRRYFKVLSATSSRKTPRQIQGLSP